MQPRSDLKLTFVGIGETGKSAIVIRALKEYFLEEYDSTIEDSYLLDVQFNNKIHTVDVLDTAGQEEYSAMRDQYMRTSECFILVYSITSRKSFDAIADFYFHILRVKDLDKFPMILVGNKCDLEIFREVSYEEGIELAEVLDCPFFETSPKDNININEIFVQSIQSRLAYIQETNAPQRPKKSRRFSFFKSKK